VAEPETLTNWLTGWLVMTGWAKANKVASHARQMPTTMLLKCFMYIIFFLFSGEEAD
jgi:hypothetical protein